MMKSLSYRGVLISSIFAAVFFLLGILNAFLVHIVPGLIYIFLGILLLPKTNAFFKQKLNFSLPFWSKVLMFILVMWFTLGVGDLMEMFEAWLIK